MKNTSPIRLTLAILWLLIGAPLLWADNCGSPDDCKVPPPNISKAVVVVSIFAGAGLAFRSMNGSNGGDEDVDGPDPDPQAPEAQSTNGGDGNPGPLPAPDDSGAKNKLGALGEDPPGGN